MGFSRSVRCSSHTVLIKHGLNLLCYSEEVIVFSEIRMDFDWARELVRRCLESSLRVLAPSLLDWDCDRWNAQWVRERWKIVHLEFRYRIWGSTVWLWWEDVLHTGWFFTYGCWWHHKIDFFVFHFFCELLDQHPSDLLCCAHLFIVLLKFRRQ